jgi:hypothetical protein
MEDLIIRSNQVLKSTLPGAIPSFLMTTITPNDSHARSRQRGLALSR